MKLHFLATGDAPERYSFDGDTITAEKDGQSETWDLSGLETGGQFQGVTVDSLPLAPGHVIRDAYRDDAGELHVTLCQPVGEHDWTDSQDEIDAADYDPGIAMVQLVGLRNQKELSDYAPAWNAERKQFEATPVEKL